MQNGTNHTLGGLKRRNFSPTSETNDLARRALSLLAPQIRIISSRQCKRFCAPKAAESRETFLRRQTPLRDWERRLVALRKIPSSDSAAAERRYEEKGESLSSLCSTTCGWRRAQVSLSSLPSLARLIPNPSPAAPTATKNHIFCRCRYVRKAGIPTRDALGSHRQERQPCLLYSNFLCARLPPFYKSEEALLFLPEISFQCTWLFRAKNGKNSVHNVCGMSSEMKLGNNNSPFAV